MMELVWADGDAFPGGLSLFKVPVCPISIDVRDCRSHVQRDSSASLTFSFPAGWIPSLWKSELGLSLVPYKGAPHTPLSVGMPYAPPALDTQGPITLCTPHP